MRLVIYTTKRKTVKYVKKLFSKYSVEFEEINFQENDVRRIF